MDITRQTITVPDGREIEFVTAGPLDGMPLVQHEGTPFGLVLLPSVVEAAAQRGLRCVFAARPGYEGSTPQPGRRVADVAEDTAAVLDALGAGEFVTMGCSGGGPHALACAALLPGRCRAAASVAGPAPWGAQGLNWLAGMGPENAEGFAIARAGDPQLTELLTVEAGSLRAVTGEQVVMAFGGLVDQVDKAALTSDFADVTAARLRAAVRNGIAGWHGDALAGVNEWGFALNDPAMSPVAIWQGGQDRMVPYAHGEWLARNVAGARAHLMPGEGHFSLAIGGILDDLIDMAGLRSRRPVAAEHGGQAAVSALITTRTIT
jgi:pimeloyl-ACP methyl ester carboxylesterase